MARQFTSDTLASLYYDDFQATDNYHQILFNTGRALQARELTQLQTLIYAEMSRFGKNIFKEGAVVNPGGVSINSNYSFVKIASTNAGGDFANIPIGTIFTNPDTEVEAQVLEVQPASAAFLFDTLYVQYINSGAASVSSEPAVFGDGETLYDQNGLGYELITENPNCTGKGVKFDVSEGDFFVLGRFVHANTQSLILSPYTNAVTTTVGYKVVQEVITVNDTPTLYDNAGGIVNTSSPGADRYRIRLELTTQDQTTSDDTFVFLANIENSKIVEIVEANDAYNKINDVLALRTSEESGNYIVNPFVINIKEGVTDSSLDLIVSAGTAYVNGYRVNNPSPIKLRIPKPTEYETSENDIVPVVYGNYFLADSSRGLPNLTLDSVSLYNGYSATGNVIGSTRIRAVERDGAKLRVYVTDFSLDSANRNIRSVRSIGTSATDRFNLTLEGTNVNLYAITDNDLLFPTSRPRLESLDDIILTRQRYFSGTSTGGSTLTITAGTDEIFTDTSLWIVGRSSATFETGYTVTLSGSPLGKQATISGLAGASTAYEVLAYTQKSGATAIQRTKTSTTATATISSMFDSSNGVTYFNFGVPDVFAVDSVKSSSTGYDLSSIFVFDDGQRDNYYTGSKLILKSGVTNPGSIYVNYRYFARGANGDFYAASSYDVEYKDIPDHTLKDGTVVSLRNYLDFRPDIDSVGVVSNIHYLPRNGTNITADINYYLPRADKLIVTQEGDFQILMGQQAANPQFKPTPNNSLELYKIILNGNTLDENDMQITPIEHKRYTMADIAKLEAKIDQIAETTSLSIKELELKLANILDSDGNVRVECGFCVDEFKDQVLSDTTNDDYAASIDPENNLIRPLFSEDNIRLIFDAGLSSNVVKKGDNIYLDFDSEQWAYQSLASRTIQVNSTGAIDFVGTLKLSPSSDEWKESEFEAEKAIAGSNKLDQNQAYLWNNWQWNWSGRSAEDMELYYDQIFTAKGPIRKREIKKLVDRYSASGPSSTFFNGKYVSRVVASDTLRSVVGNRVVDVALIPWVRSRKIYFHAQGLKPNTKFTPFFDGENVSEWCREEATFVQWADRDSDIGNQYTSTTYEEHPEGTSDLVSDANGEIIGSFFVPNISPEYFVATVGKRKKKKSYVGLRFRSGVREFKLLDIDRNDWNTAESKAFAYYTAVGAIENRSSEVLSTRSVQYTLPFGGFYNANIPSVYLPNEINQALNAVGAASVGIVDPQLAGRYGPGTTPLTASALNSLQSTSSMSQVLSDYIAVNTNQFAGTSGCLPAPTNPLAQTFYVDNQFGLVVSKINLYFAAKPQNSNLPVAIHLRPVVNGKPSTTAIVPDSYVFLNPGQVTTIPTNSTLSVIQARPTSFEFNEPIYLQPWTSYAIVITSASTEYELFSAKTTERVYGSTSRTVSTQAAPGSLFIPATGLSWIESKDEDLMFRIARAKFSLGGGSIILKNAGLPAKLLSSDPILAKSGTRKLYFKHPAHGLEPGDPVIIADAETVSGILAADINGVRTVDSADAHGFTITAGGSTNASASATGGGKDVLTTRNKVFTVVNPYIENIVPNLTSVDMSAKFTSGKLISGSTTRFTVDPQYVKITPKTNSEYYTPKAIYQPAQETSSLAGNKSVYFKIDVKSSNDYVSPIIDLQRSSLILVGEMIDDSDVTPHIYPVSETSPYGGTSASKHITTPIFLEQAAVGMEVSISAAIPNGYAIEYYYRTANADENINDKNWTYQAPTTTTPNDNNGTLRRLTYLPGGQGGTLPPFTQAQSKFVLKGRGNATSGATGSAIGIYIKDLTQRCLVV